MTYRPLPYAAATALYFYMFIVTLCNTERCEVSPDGTLSCDLCDTEPLLPWLSQNGSVPGYHILCITNQPNHGLHIELYRDGIKHPLHTGQHTAVATTTNSIQSLRMKLEDVLQMDRANAWRMYTSSGVVVFDIPGFIGLILIFEGGVFMYPAIHIGFVRDVVVETKPMQLTTLSVHPPVFSITNFVTYDECDHIISISQPYMRDSEVSHTFHTEGNPNKWRTSSTHRLDDTVDRVTDKIEQYCAKLLHIPQTHQEAIQVLRYKEGEQYDLHNDYFHPWLYRGTEMEDEIRGGQNRVATLFWYMSDVYSGGWTYFPLSGQLSYSTPASFKLKKMSDCHVGLKVPPRKGTVILFYSQKANGEFDPLTLHGACPVGKGNIKWAANIWYWSKPL